MNLLNDTVVLLSARVWADMEFLGAGIDESTELDYLDNAVLYLEYTEETPGASSNSPQFARESGGRSMEKIRTDGPSRWRGPLRRGEGGSPRCKGRIDENNNFNYEGFYLIALS